MAELKGTFDRFAVDGLLTIGEACQALTEVGIVVPRREIFKHLRSRGIKGLQRNVSFFEFMYGYSTLRYVKLTIMIARLTSTPRSVYDEHFRGRARGKVHGVSNEVPEPLS